MNTGVQIFNNPTFGEIRVTEMDGKTYFMGSDVAKALGYVNPRDAIARHCKSGGVVKRDTLINGITQSVTYIDEGNIYRLAAKSELPGAEAFESWIFDEVLPSIRKTGAYATPATIDAIIADPEFGIKLLSSLKEERQKRMEAERIQAELRASGEAMRPKALFADAVAASDRSVLVSELAKILKQNGVEIGQNRPFVWLREKGYLCSKGEYYNQPTQKAMELGLFELKKTSIAKPDGSVLVTGTTKVTGKGQIYFVNKFIGNKSVAQ